MSSFVSKGYFSYQWILWFAFVLLMLDMISGYIILPFYKGTVAYLERKDKNTPKKFLSSYLSREQVALQLSEAQEIVNLRNATDEYIPGEIKVNIWTEIGISIAYCLIMACTSVWGIHLGFAFFYATKNTLDNDESSLVTQITVIYLIVVSLTNIIANSVGFYNQRKRAFLIGLVVSIFANLGFATCYYYDSWTSAKGVLFVCLFANAGIINASVFSLIAETVSNKIMVFSYSFINVIFFTGNLIYPYIMKRTDDFKIYMYGMLVLSCMGVVGIVLTGLFIAETGNKTKKEIYERIFWKKAKTSEKDDALL